MELAISAITGDLISRFISFLMNKYSAHVSSEEKVKRLQQLLLRVHMVVEEADGRYITNSGMLLRLKTLAAAMYQGYHVLDTINYRHHKEGGEELVSDSSTLSASTPLKRSRKIGSTTTKKVFNLELQNVLQDLETVIANMTEFVFLLGGCERMSRKPYDTYLYMDNFMFGRHVEKQQLTKFMLQGNSSGPPAVLAIVGGRGVGKKTLIAHTCNDESVRSYFSLILHLTEDDFFRLSNQERQPGRTLVVVEFVSDVDEEDWRKFYSSVTCMDRGSKVIILGRNEKLERFGTAKPICLNCLAYEEYRYLFKTLAFGSANPMDHPELMQIVDEFPMLLGGSLISANLLGDVLRKNLHAQFWLFRLNGIRITVKKNMSTFGAHPQVLFNRGLPVHGHQFILYPAASSTTNVPGKDLSKVIFGDILAGHTVPPKEDFSLISWESRLPPYTSFIHLVRFAPSCVDNKPGRLLSGRKRPGPFIA